MTPGAGGWITSENMADFIDEQGNFVGLRGGLGPGAGITRGRDGVEGMDGEDDGEPVGDDVGEENEESKWRRTE